MKTVVQAQRNGNNLILMDTMQVIGRAWWEKRSHTTRSDPARASVSGKWRHNWFWTFASGSLRYCKTHVVGLLKGEKRYERARVGSLFELRRRPPWGFLWLFFAANVCVVSSGRRRHRRLVIFRKNGQKSFQTVASFHLLCCHGRFIFRARRVVYAQLKVTYIWAIDDRRPPTSTLYGTVKSTLWIFFCQNCFIRRLTVLFFFLSSHRWRWIGQSNDFDLAKERELCKHTHDSHWFDFLFATFSCQFTTFSSIFSSLVFLPLPLGVERAAGHSS